MARKKYTQEQQVIDVLRQIGGYATLGDLYRLVDTKSWATKTPNESIRRIVQQSEEIFKIQPGLWALEDCREEVMRKFDLLPNEKQCEEQFTHGYAKCKIKWQMGYSAVKSAGKVHRRA